MTVPEARTRLLAVMVVLLVLDVAAVVVLLTPLGRPSAASRDNAQQVRVQLREEMRRALPLRNIDQKLGESRQQIQQFTRERLPQRDSAIPEELGRVAAANAEWAAEAAKARASGRMDFNMDGVLVCLAFRVRRKPPTPVLRTDGTPVTLSKL